MYHNRGEVCPKQLNVGDEWAVLSYLQNTWQCDNLNRSTQIKKLNVKSQSYQGVQFRLKLLAFK